MEGKLEIGIYRMGDCGLNSFEPEYRKLERPFVNHSNDMNVPSIKAIISLPGKRSVNITVYILCSFIPPPSPPPPLPVKAPGRPSFHGTVPVVWILKRPVPLSHKIRFTTSNALGFSKSDILRLKVNVLPITGH